MIVLKRLGIILSILSYVMLWIGTIVTGQLNGPAGLILFLTIIVPVVGFVIVILFLWFVVDIIYPMWNWIHGEDWI